ncbi:MAG: hypothetical protein ACK56I_03455, partial [bacterium]
MARVVHGVFGVVDHRHNLRALQAQEQAQRSGPAAEHTRVDHVFLGRVARPRVGHARQDAVDR